MMRERLVFVVEGTNSLDVPTTSTVEGRLQWIHRGNLPANADSIPVWRLPRNYKLSPLQSPASGQRGSVSV